MSSPIDIKDVVTLPERYYGVLEREVASLRPSKRKNWRGRLMNTRGVATRVVYRDGEFFQSGTNRRVVSSDRWIEEHGPSSTPAKRLPVSAVVAFAENFDRALARGETGDEAAQDTLDQIFQQELISNHTGNHSRNKTVKIPTAAGQPCRA